jgi:hypothetical protein
MAEPQPTDPEIARVRRIAKVLDTYMVDPIIGLVFPGAGDLVGTALGMYTVALAFQRKMSPMVIARMLLNLAFDFAIGAIPLVGDATDFVFKANQRNVALLEDRAARGGKSSWRDWLAVAGAFALLFAVVGLAVYATGRLIGWLF